MTTPASAKVNQNFGGAGVGDAAGAVTAAGAGPTKLTPGRTVLEEPVESARARLGALELEAREQLAALRRRGEQGEDVAGEIEEREEALQMIALARDQLDDCAVAGRRGRSAGAPHVESRRTRRP